MDKKELKVELLEHVGQKNINFGGDKIEVDVDFKQYVILVNGKEVGLVCQADKSPVNLLPSANVFPVEVREQIAEAVKVELAKRHGETDRKTFHPPSNEAVAAANAAIAAQRAREESLSDPAADENNL